MTLQAILTQHSILALAATLILIGVDALLGIAKAAAAGQFSFARLGQFVATHILPQVGGLMLGAVVQHFAAIGYGGLIGTAAATVFWGAVITVNLTLLRDILAKLGIKASGTGAA